MAARSKSAARTAAFTAVAACALALPALAQTAETTLTVRIAGPSAAFGPVRVNGWPADSIRVDESTARVTIPPDADGQLYCINDIAMSYKADRGQEIHVSRAVDICNSDGTVTLTYDRNDAARRGQPAIDVLQWTTVDMIGEPTPVPILSYEVPETDARLIEVRCLNLFAGATFSVGQLGSGVAPGETGRITISASPGVAPGEIIMPGSRPLGLHFSYDAVASQPSSDEEPSQLRLDLSLQDPLFAVLRSASELSLRTTRSDFVTIPLRPFEPIIDDFFDRCWKTNPSPAGGISGTAPSDSAQPALSGGLSGLQAYLDAAEAPEQPAIGTAGLGISPPQTPPAGGTGSIGQSGFGAERNAPQGSGLAGTSPDQPLFSPQGGTAGLGQPSGTAALGQPSGTPATQPPIGGQPPAGNLPGWLNGGQTPAAPQQPGQQPTSGFPPQGQGGGTMPPPVTNNPPPSFGGQQQGALTPTVPSAGTPPPAAPAIYDPFPRQGVAGEFQRNRQYFGDFMATCATDGVCEAVTFSNTQTDGGGTFVSPLDVSRGPSPSAGWEITLAGPFEPPAPGASAIVEIDGETWRLEDGIGYERVGNGTVFLPPVDEELMAAMRAGIAMTVTYQVSSGRQKSVTYSLRGLVASMNFFAEEQQRNPQDLTLRVPLTR